MSQSANDVRVRRSQKFIREAFIDLIEEHEFDALSVGEITERAMVSRATFYRNYQDKFDLVEKIFAESIQALLDAVSDAGSEHPPQVWVCFFEHIAEYEQLYRALLGRKGSPWFVIKMRASLVDLIKEYEQIPFLQPMAKAYQLPIVDGAEPYSPRVMWVRKDDSSRRIVIGSRFSAIHKNAPREIFARRIFKVSPFRT